MGKKKAASAATKAASPRRNVCARCAAGFDLWSNYGGGNYEDDLVGQQHLFADGEPTTDPVLTYYGDLIDGRATTALCMRCARASVHGGGSVLRERATTERAGDDTSGR